MKIADTNIYYGSWPFRDAGETDFSRIKTHCVKNGVGTFIVSSVNSIFYEDPFEGDIKLHEAIAGEKNAYHIMTVNPFSSGWKEDVRTAVNEFGIRGIKIYPGYHGYQMQDPALAQVCETAAKYDLPVIIAGQVEDLRVSYMLHPAPIPLDKLGVFLGTYRDNTFVLANFSFGDIYALRFNILSRDKVYVDMSGFIFTSFPLEKLLKTYPKEIFLFGSQFPLYVQKGILNEVTTAKLPDDIKEAVLYKNAARLFKLKQ